MTLGIYSLKKTLFEGEVLSLNCKTSGGELTILNHHRPLITRLTAGTLTIVDNNDRKHYFAVSSGFLEINSGNRIQLIIEE